ncbi:rRNA-processing protein EBP2 [Fasciola hepatica]|uniref:rRNA-processing protein EBP2 n=1 Tax=Fasciola hepatica TaxID=6192 RepID=A0A4E0QV68_FASHE|nr:rRNA-processing protein EBP2 [Fasciola hepatica]
MSDSESSSDLEELIACPGLYKEIQQPKHHPNNKPALENTLKHIENNLPWIERLDIVTPPAPAAKELEVENDPDKIDADDDFKRENYFYRIGQAAVLKAIPQLHALGVPTKRPADFFAEMVKSDEHMGKVKKHLVETQQRLALRERARQMREKRKFGKQTQLAVLQARKAEKRQLSEAIKASRKKSGHNRAELLDSILNQFRDEHEPKPNQKKVEAKQTGFHRAKDVANRRK